MDKADDDVRDLDARVVDIVLDLDAISRGLQDADKRVAEHGVTNVTDVRGFVRVDARVLDHLLGTIVSRGRWSCQIRNGDQTQQFGAIEKDVDVSGARD